MGPRTPGRPVAGPAGEVDPPWHRRLAAAVEDWTLHGVRYRNAVYLAYLMKLTGYVSGAVVVIGLGPGVGSIGDVSSWWASPIAYQKFVIWTILWEVLGLGSGSGPLNLRFLPPVGGLLYWLRPGTVRLPPWPGKIAFTTGTRRGVVDVALYVGVLAFGAALLAGGNTDGAAYDTVARPWLWAMLGCLGALGVRDKTVFLAARPEHYAMMLLVFAFAPGNMIFALKLCLLAAWWSAAITALDRKFPYALAALVTETPWVRRACPPRAAWRPEPDTLRPARWVVRLAAGVAATEIVVPVLAITSRGGALTVVAVTLMVASHVLVLSTFPRGACLEWHVFACYATLFLFGRYAAAGAATLTSALLILLLVIGLVLLPALGSFAPRLMSGLMTMRGVAANPASSIWLFREGGAEATLAESFGPGGFATLEQAALLHDAPTAGAVRLQHLTRRTVLPHGRALTGLLARAVDDLERYTLRDGEAVANAVLGWSLDDGHLHDQQLLRAVQERCGFEAGQVRIVALEAQPIHKRVQRYWIFDAASGKQEEGTVRVADLLEREPWLPADAAVPVRICFRVLPPPAHRSPVGCGRPLPPSSTFVLAPAGVRPTPGPRVLADVGPR